MIISGYICWGNQIICQMYYCKPFISQEVLNETGKNNALFDHSRGFD